MDGVARVDGSGARVEGQSEGGRLSVKHDPLTVLWIAGQQQVEPSVVATILAHRPPLLAAPAAPISVPPIAGGGEELPPFCCREQRSQRRYIA